MPVSLSWEEKLEAFQALAGGVTIAMRRPGDWFCSVPADIAGNGALLGLVGNGESVGDAVLEAWKKGVTELQPPLYLALRGGTDLLPQGYRWNGFMWRVVS